MKSYRGKRLFDICLTAPALILLLPILLIISLFARIKHGSPVLFRQQRPGLHGKPFTLYKFRTMTNARDANGNLLPDADRLTSFGRFLRRTSLDELPELINVLKGDMSLVGPRPLLMQYMPYYTPREQLRHSVRPGITGLAQISGRNMVDWDSRLALDVEYVENWTLWLDIKILFKTVANVMRRSGVVDVPVSIMNDLDIERSEKRRTVNGEHSSSS